MKKNRSLPIIILTLFVQSVNAQYYETIENVKLFKERMSPNILMVIPEGDVIKLENISSEVAKVEYRGLNGYVDMSAFRKKMKEVDPGNVSEEKLTAINLPAKTNAIDIPEDIAKLMVYTDRKRKAKNAHYAFIGATAVFAGFSFLADKPGASNALYVLSGISGAGIFATGIYMIELQHKINKQNINVHLNANGINITF